MMGPYCTDDVVLSTPPNILQTPQELEPANDTIVQSQKTPNERISPSPNKTTPLQSPGGSDDVIIPTRRASVVQCITFQTEMVPKETDPGLASNIPPLLTEDQNNDPYVVPGPPGDITNEYSQPLRITLRNRQYTDCHDGEYVVLSDAKTTCPTERDVGKVLQRIQGDFTFKKLVMEDTPSPWAVEIHTTR